MVLISITLGSLTRMPFGSELVDSFPWAWYRGPGWPFTVAVLGLGAWFHFKPTAYSRIRELAGWFCGIAFVYTTWYAVTPEPGFDLYRTLISPFMWVATAGGVTWLLERGLRIDGWIKYLFYILAILLPSVATIIPIMNSAYGNLISLLISVVVAIGFTVLILLDSRGRLS